MVFTLDQARHGVAVATAQRVVPMVAVTPLPGAPSLVLGMISLHGEPIAVVDIRRRLGLAPRMYGAGSHLVIAATARRKLAIVVDEVLAVEEIDDDSIIKADFVAPGLGRVAGVATLPDGLVLIHDLEALLSLDDERTLEAALATPA